MQDGTFQTPDHPAETWTRGDVFAANGALGQAVSAANFLKDVNVNGLLTFGDNFAVNNQTGNVLPGP